MCLANDSIVHRSEGTDEDSNVVIWEKDQCFDVFAGVLSKQICAKGATATKNSHANRNAYVGIACECDQRHGFGDGFRCTLPCNIHHGPKIKRCGGVNEQCFIEPSSGQQVCGCSPGFRANVTSDGKTVCLLEDLCGSCSFACHKASRCMPPTKGSYHGYTCDRCDPRKGYTGDGFICKDIDECADENLNKCDRANAICINKSPVEDNGLKYMCQCKSGWRGDPIGGYQWRKCKDTDECLTKTACGKHAKCVNTPGSYYCSCLNGYTKAFENITECVDIDECALQKPCGENAYCINTEGSFVCKCKKGFVPTRWKNYCKPDKNYWCKKCDKESTICVLNQANDCYKCACKNGFQPIPGDTNRCADIPNCLDPNMNDCDKTPGYATCIDTPGGYRCTCNQGFVGDGRHCTPTNPCNRHNPCANIGGTECFNDNGKAKCRCKKGFVRPFNDRYNENKPCLDETIANVYSCSLCDNATSFCQRIHKNRPFYACRCADGYIMNAAGRCTNINECLRIWENNCDPNANCIDKQPAIDGIRYECLCKEGFSGNGTMRQCVDINECKGASKVCRLPHQICINTIGSYQCDCEKGYRKLPGLQACININECEQGTANCPPNSRCEDHDPGYTCRCLPGFTNKTLNGKMVCSNVDECKEGLGPTGMSACDAANGICKDTIGSFLCSCKHGFMLQADGKTCSDIDECKRGEDTCDWQVQICNNTIGSFRCDCKYGLISKDGTCEDRDECKDGSNKCLRHSRCINTFASYRCECKEGFTPAPSTHPLRPRCERQNVCAQYPSICAPGKCVSTQVQPFFTCSCPLTSVAINSTKCVYPNYCDAKFACPKHATCVNGECACERGYRWMESDVFPRTVDSLKHRPACKAIDPCAESDLCPSPLKCKSTGPGLYECVCKDGYEKVPINQGTCIDIDECNLETNAASCPSNSHCENLKGSYKCECNIGFTRQIGSSLIDPECVDIDECAAGIDNCAMKNATCINSIGSFECICAEGFRRKPPHYEMCHDIDECRDGTAECDENAICKNTMGSYECDCKEGYFGDGALCMDIDECNPADPKHSCNRTTQQCNNLPGTYECKCKKGYKPVYGGCQDIDECLSPRNNDCAKRGGDVPMKCLNEEGGYRCDCPSGYVETADGVCEDIDECKNAAPPCPPTSVDLCVNVKGGFKCTCRSGFRKPRECHNQSSCACVDINECKQGIVSRNGTLRSACGKAAKCSNTLGGYKCVCAPGYGGDPYADGCKVFDSCVAANPCNKATQVCEQFGKKAFCKCKIGYLAINERSCVKNPCGINNGGCGRKSKCRAKRVGNHFVADCLCEPGYELDATKNCIPVDYCGCKVKSKFGIPCESKKYCTADHMLCLNTHKLYNCTCASGYRLTDNKTACININECKEGVGANLNEPACDASAKCVDTDGHYFCECPRGQNVDFYNKCKIDTPTCSRENNCIGDPNAYCAKVDATHRYCQCKAGYVGDAIPGGAPCIPQDYCKEARDAINGEPCGPNEVCVNSNTSYACECGVGFQRPNPGGECKDVDECAFGASLCRETYQCKNTIGSYECVCPSGYFENATSKQCDDIDECKQQVQLCNVPEERCVNLPGSYRCECSWPAYVPLGEFCVDNNECSKKEYNCPLFSTCVNTVGGYNCTCNRGFRATNVVDGRVTRCEDIDECVEDNNACPSLSQCRNRAGTWECLCKPPAIQHGTQDCVLNATCPECSEHAHCLRSERPQGTIFNCTCDVGYTGDGVHRCDPIDECELGIAKCNRHAECIDLTPLYECRCKSPYFAGDGINRCNRVDLCAHYNDCPSDARCIPLDERYAPQLVTCECPKGFVFNNRSRNCDDVNECAPNNGLGLCVGMPKGTQCVNTQGSFFCRCPSGYETNVNGTQCNDIDECLTTNFDVCWQTGGICKNVPGSYECTCPTGLRQSTDKMRCIDVNECKEGIDNCDKATSTCVNFYGDYMCLCKQGYGYVPQKTNKCQDIDECAMGSDNCTALSETCYNTPGAFYCNCSKGYRRNSRGICLPEAMCDGSVRCGTNALCVMRPSKSTPNKLSPQCVCKDGYIGKDPKKSCEPIYECHTDDQCAAHAHCTKTTNNDGLSVYRCICNEGYRRTGSYCEQIDECHEQPAICGNNTICIDLDPHYKCVCQPGTVNVAKGKDKIKCEPMTCKNVKNPCHRDAKCIDIDGGYICKCPPGFVGAGTPNIGCESVDYCKKHRMCSTHATCVNGNGSSSIVCVCNTGFRGDGFICNDIDECANENANICDGNATCINTQGSYTCQCSTGYEGNGLPGMCKDVDECASPILNKCDSATSKCRNTEGSFECTCLPGFEHTGNNSYACTDINECVMNRTICGQHHCGNLRGDYRCDCSKGFQTGPDQHSCTDIDECAENNPCHTNARCVNTAGSYTCMCTGLYEGDGFNRCDPIDQCKVSNRCDQKTSTCQMIEGQAAYKCVCNPGFRVSTSINGHDVCEDVDECIEGEAKFNAMTQECINIIGGYRIQCKTGYVLDRSGLCVDKDECAQDPAYAETLEKFRASLRAGTILKASEWKSWMVKPKNSSSAYAICYERASSTHNWWWFTSASSALPFCRNTVYDERGAFGGNEKTAIMKGFECDCLPGQVRRQYGTPIRIVLTCEDADLCVYLNCSSLGEGWVCDRANHKCICDSAAGYTMRIADDGIPFCTTGECTSMDTTGPHTVKNAMHRSLIRCDVETHRWIQPVGYIFVRETYTNFIIGLQDINECEDENYCCNRTAARCDRNESSCWVKCSNFEGGASCYCDKNNPNVEIDPNTCQCRPKCSLNSAWYLKCDVNSLSCDYAKWQRLLDSSTAPNGTVCSRLSNNNGVYMDFPSMFALVAELCRTNFYCGMPPEEIDDIRMLPVFNYEGKCIVSKAQVSQVKCPFGDKPLAMDGLAGPYAFCPYKIDMNKWPGADPSYPKRGGTPMPLMCLEDGVQLNEKTQFFQYDFSSYGVENL